MLNKKIKALETIIAGLTLYAEAMRECETNCNDTTVAAPTAHSATPVTAAEPEDTETDDEQEDDTPSTANYTVEELSEMSYNDLKKLAASLNIKAVGSRKALVDAVMSAIGVSDDDTADEPDEDEPVSETADDAEPEDDDDDSAETDDDKDGDTSDDEEDDEPTTEQLVLEATEDMTDDELRDLLESVDVSGKGKRQSLIAKLVTAVEKGLISLSDEEDDEEPDDEDTADADDTADEPETDEKSSEPFGDVTAGMSKKRRAAFDDLCDTTQDSFNNGEITRDDLTEFLMQFDEDNNKKSLNKLSDEDLIVKYLSACAMLVSDDGEVVEEGAYTIDDVPYCCGRPLNYNKKTGNYKCSCCGAEYEAE